MDCSICLNKMDNKNVVITKCEHKFHVECFMKWMANQQTCPNCREQLLEKSLSKFKIRIEHHNNGREIMLQEMEYRHIRAREVEKRMLYLCKYCIIMVLIIFIYIKVLFYVYNNVANQVTLQ